MYIGLDVRLTIDPLSGTRLRQWRFSDQPISERMEGNHTVFQLHLMPTEYSTTALHYCTQVQEYVS
jgi:hypothetical protein